MNIKLKYHNYLKDEGAGCQITILPTLYYWWSKNDEKRVSCFGFCWIGFCWEWWINPSKENIYFQNK